MPARRGWWIAALLLLAGCAAGNGPGVRYEEGLRAAVTGDGLHRVRAYRTDALYVLPGADLSGYDGFIVAPVTIRYREPRPGESRRAFVESERKRLEAALRSELEDAFERSSSLVPADAPGPRVLRVRAELVDLALGLSRDSSAREITVWTTTEFRFLIDVADSESGTSLVRTVDRQQLHPTSTGPPLATAAVARPSGTQVTAFEEDMAIREAAGNRARAFCENFERLRRVGAFPEPPARTN